MEREIRYYDFSRENREFAPHVAEDNSRIVEGYAIVFNQPSRQLYDRASKKVFTEIIDPRAVTDLMLSDQDIKMLYNHSNDMLLARSTYGYGTLKYEVDEYGVKYRFEMPNTSVGNDVLELIKRGDVWGCSFAFTYAKDGVKDEKRNGHNYRTVIGIESIDDFSIVVDPAYLGTYVCTREFCAGDGAADERAANDVARVKLDLDILEMELGNL